VVSLPGRASRVFIGPARRDALDDAGIGMEPSAS
jgi:hypothetical protein